METSASSKPGPRHRSTRHVAECNTLHCPKRANALSRVLTRQDELRPEPAYRLALGWHLIDAALVTHRPSVS